MSAASAGPAVVAPPAVLAVDVGNSKTDLAIVAADGAVLAAVRGETTSHQAVGWGEAMRRLVTLAERVAFLAGLDARARPLANLASVGAAGADTSRDRRRLRGALARTGLARDVVLANDTDAALRAGSAVGWGVALICGAGVNCLAIAPNGRAARLPAFGDLSGDWGGGEGVGLAGLQAAIRGRDGRGPRTLLERTLPPILGCRRPLDVALAIYAGRLAQQDLGALAPAVFEAAANGDREARAIVDHLADELAGMAGAAVRRLGITRREVPIALAGGVFRTTDRGFHDRLRAGLSRTIPQGTVTVIDVPPVAGAALLGLDHLAGGRAAPAVEARLRAGLQASELA